jgi:hypothetical protein
MNQAFKLREDKPVEDTQAYFHVGERVVRIDAKPNPREALRRRSVAAGTTPCAIFPGGPCVLPYDTTAQPSFAKPPASRTVWQNGHVICVCCRTCRKADRQHASGWRLFRQRLRSRRGRADPERRREEEDQRYDRRLLQHDNFSRGGCRDR